MTVDEAVAPPVSDERRKRKRRRRAALALFVIGVVVVLLSPYAFRRMEYFRVRRVMVEGARYVQPKSLLDALALDSSATIWHDLRAMEARVQQHPQVRSVTISRRLPGTLVLHVVENLPVAFLATPQGMQALDRDGHILPIDPSRTAVDLPIVAKRDSLVLQLLEGVRATDPALFARIDEIRWDVRGELRVIMSGETIRAFRDCTLERFVEIIPVEQDLARRGLRVTELDLRYRDQIVARIE